MTEFWLRILQNVVIRVGNLVAGVKQAAVAAA